MFSLCLIEVSRGLEGPGSYYKPYSKHFSEFLEFSRIFSSFLVFYRVFSRFRGARLVYKPYSKPFWARTPSFLAFSIVFSCFLKVSGAPGAPQNHRKRCQSDPKSLTRPQIGLTKPIVNRFLRFSSFLVFSRVFSCFLEV